MAIAHTGMNYKIESLQKENYDTWYIQAQIVLIRSGLWGYVTNDEEEQIPKPTSPDTEIRRWEREEKQAKSELLLIIALSELKQIKDCKTAQDIWKKLKSIYQSTGPARKAALLKQLILRKMQESDDVRDRLRSLDDTVDKLKQMVNIDNDLLSIMILYSLPTTLENFRVAIETRDKLPSPDELKIKIIEEAEASKKNIKDSAIESAFTSKSKNKQKGNYHSRYKQQDNKNHPQKIICRKCDKPGHKSFECE